MPTTTMKRIAGELGVSITTVSKVLNNRDDIGHATRARVLAKVAELGYQPNAVARSLTPPPHPHARHRHPRSDALVLRRDRRRHRAGRQRARLRPAAVQLERGSRQGARRSSTCSAAARSTASSSRRPTHPATPTCCSSSPRSASALVMIDRDDHPDVNCDRVVTDDEQVGRLATAHLLDAGTARDRAHHRAADRPRQAARATAGARR